MVSETAHSILERVRDPLNLAAVMKKYPVLYEESMNTVLIQEVIRYNRLLTTLKRTLRDMLKALKGLVVMSAELEKMFNSLYNNAVPSLWAAKVRCTSTAMVCMLQPLRFNAMDFCNQSVQCCWPFSCVIVAPFVSCQILHVDMLVPRVH